MSDDFVRMPLAELVQYVDEGRIEELDERITRAVRPWAVGGPVAGTHSLSDLHVTLPPLAKALAESRIDVDVLVEFPMPGSAYRADFVLIGSHYVDRKYQSSLLTIEVRNWRTLTEARDISRGTVSELPARSFQRAGRNHYLTNPAEVALAHAQRIRDFSGSALGDSFSLNAVAYLPNADGGTMQAVRRAIQRRKSAPDEYPPECFGRGEMADMIAFLESIFQESPGAFKGAPAARMRAKQNADEYLANRFRPTGELLTRAKGRIECASEFRLTDEQLEIVDEVSEEIYEHLGQKRTRIERVKASLGAFLDRPQPALRLSSTKRLIVLTGRPGTGKTVVGVELLRRAWRERWNARYSSPSTSFNENMRRCFGSGDARATALFTSVRKLAPFADRPLDLLIVDEAHRLPTYPWTQRTKAALREQRLPTVQEVLKASHTIVCFIDESQRVRPKETLTVDELAALAEAEGFDVVHYTLAKTFRAGGEPGYDDWVRALLGMDEGGTELQPGEVRYPERKGAPFDVVTTASAADLEKLIRAKDNPQDPGAGGRARLTAGFAWKWESYKKVTKLPPDVRDGDWAMPWNAREKQRIDGVDVPKNEIWATEPEGIGQLGCIYTAQGFEFGWVGVLFGEDLVRRDGRWVTQPKNSWDSEIRRAKPEAADAAIRNAYRVLMTRGLRGVAVYSVDPDTQRYFSEHIRAHP